MLDSEHPNFQINVLLAGFYDCVQLYAWAVNRTLSEGKDPLDGRYLINEILNSTRIGEFESRSGEKATGLDLFKKKLMRTRHADHVIRYSRETF